MYHYPFNPFHLMFTVYISYTGQTRRKIHSRNASPDFIRLLSDYCICNFTVSNRFADIRRMRFQEKACIIHGRFQGFSYSGYNLVCSYGFIRTLTHLSIRISRFVIAKALLSEGIRLSINYLNNLIDLFYFIYAILI